MATTIYLVRHAHAGDRSAWSGDDELRPLSPEGSRQAEALVDQLAGGRPHRLVSSPAVRCIDTLVPLGRKLGLRVETDARLAEGADAADAASLLAELAPGGCAAVCSHGDVIPDLLDLLAGRGMALHGPARWEKGSTWELTWGAEGATSARYLPPA